MNKNTASLLFIPNKCILLQSQKYIYTMHSKKERLKTILDLIGKTKLSNQEELLFLLKKKGFDITQATLSRDMKELKIIKSPDADGNYIYTDSSSKNTIGNNAVNELASNGVISLAFSEKLAVIKTRPGYAMGIASDIDLHVSHVVLGTIAGDDTILLIPKEKFSREEIIKALTLLIPSSALLIE